MANAERQYGFTLTGVDTFGNRKISSQNILDVLGVNEGVHFEQGALNLRKMCENIEALGYFSHVHLALVLYPNGKAYITVDVIEKGHKREFILRPPAEGSVDLPEELLKMYDQYLARSGRNIRNRSYFPIQSTEKSPSGHRFSADPNLRGLEERFIDLAQRYLEPLIDTLEGDRNSQKRVVAAALLGWSPDPVPTLSPLSKAVNDHQPIVRNNAALSLAHASRIAIQMKTFKVPLLPILQMLHFPFTTDRQKAALVLAELAESKKFRSTILKEAGNQLIRMLVLKQPSNREAACKVLRRISGLDYAADQYNEWHRWYKQATRGIATPVLEEPDEA